MTMETGSTVSLGTILKSQIERLAAAAAALVGHQIMLLLLNFPFFALSIHPSKLP